MECQIFVQPFSNSFHPGVYNDPRPGVHCGLGEELPGPPAEIHPVPQRKEPLGVRQVLLLDTRHLLRPTGHTRQQSRHRHQHCHSHATNIVIATT